MPMLIRPISRSVLLPVFLGVACLAGCGLSATTPDFAVGGSVVFVDVEGGCWGIDTAQERLEPINLPERFKVDGLRVSVVADEAPDAASICQIGTLVQIESIDSIG